MAFEIYESFTRTDTPYPSIKLSKNFLSFNKAAQELVKEWDRVTLAYDKDTGQIGIMRNDKEGRGGKLSKTSTMWSVGVKGFITYFGLEKKIGARYQVDKRDGGLILIPLGKNEVRVPKNKKTIFYMCKGCSHSDPSWGKGHPHKCPKCESTIFEENVLKEKKRI